MPILEGLRRVLWRWRQWRGAARAWRYRRKEAGPWVVHNGVKAIGLAAELYSDRTIDAMTEFPIEQPTQLQPSDQKVATESCWGRATFSLAKDFLVIAARMRTCSRNLQLPRTSSTTLRLSKGVRLPCWLRTLRYRVDSHAQE